jgi:allene oxide cyclase
MKRALIPAVAGAAAVLVFAVVNATAKDKPKSEGGNTVHVIEHATTDAVTNGSATTDMAGNVLTFANGVFDSANSKKVGTDQGYCIRIVVGKTWECNWTTFLAGGQITVEGPFSDTGDTVLAITGGTGKYRNARGQMELKYHNKDGTEFDFVFDLHGGD